VGFMREEPERRGHRAEKGAEGEKLSKNKKERGRKMFLH